MAASEGFMPVHDSSNGTAPVPDVPQRDIPPRRAHLRQFAWQVVLVLLIVAAGYLLWTGVHVLLLAFAGILLAVLLSSVSDWVSRHTGWSYRRALLATVLALIVITGAFTWLLASTLVAQATELTQKVPELLTQARHQLEQYPWGQYLVERAPQAAESLAQTGAISRVTGIASGAASIFEAIIVILVVGIFGAADPEVYERGL